MSHIFEHHRRCELAHVLASRPQEEGRKGGIRGVARESETVCPSLCKGKRCG